LWRDDLRGSRNGTHDGKHHDAIFSTYETRARSATLLKRIHDLMPAGASRSVKNELRRNLLRASKKTRQGLSQLFHPCFSAVIARRAATKQAIPQFAALWIASSARNDV